jgi:hypothetical protein
VIATLSHPIKGVQAIPNNWFAVVLCTDVYTPIELVPGVGPVQDTLQSCIFEDDPVRSSFPTLLVGTVFAGILTILTYALDNLLSPPWPFYYVWHGVAAFFEFVLLIGTLTFALGFAFYAVAYCYRLSLKSTALIWLPLVYVVRKSYDQTLSLSTQLNELRQSALWKTIRIVSWAVIALLLAKILILPTIIDWWDSHTWAKVLNVYVMPNVIHPWHVGAGLNAAIALLGYYFFLDPAPRRIMEGIWSESAVRNGLQAFQLLRGLISLYTISVGVYLTLIATSSMHWPAWSWKIIPW